MQPTGIPTVEEQMLKIENTELRRENARLRWERGPRLEKPSDPVLMAVVEPLPTITMRLAGSVKAEENPAQPRSLHILAESNIGRGLWYGYYVNDLERMSETQAAEALQQMHLRLTVTLAEKLLEGRR